MKNFKRTDSQIGSRRCKTLHTMTGAVYFERIFKLTQKESLMYVTILLDKKGKNVYD
jgi:hypothetical protein